MTLLAQFVLRLAFGLAVGMAITSPRKVSSGFFRNHLYVTLGLTTLGALVLAPLSKPGFTLAATAAIVSFFGAACWLVESWRAGIAHVWLVALFSLFGALVSRSTAEIANASEGLKTATVISSGLLLGLTAAAMLLGHWYLNSPGMELAPLRRLLIAAGLAVGLQAILSSVGLAAAWQAGALVPLHWIAMRWLFGIIGVAAMLVMAWQTLKIPNTQSATGILYVAVIGAFVGELAASLLSAESAFPL
jgi:hypothetical protein